ncbi:MAG: hypothetical protein H7316_12265 [Tardiphaga sp.]|uniref:hypothetical protein n=1 Tax=Tardiphaga sp. TaxID=1926292 RepID=UPI0019C58432|nr:hypothetical protein [Tardiphaga sp.]MBC7584517.1 hypothetical protein [Tardiphaga sp.]
MAGRIGRDRQDSAGSQHVRISIAAIMGLLRVQCHYLRRGERNYREQCVVQLESVVALMGHVLLMMPPVTGDLM